MKISKCDKNVKALSQITGKLLKNNHQIALQTTYNPKKIPAKFQDFFNGKINRIGQDFNTDLHTDNHYNPIQMLHVLEEATMDEVRRVIMNSPKKSCELDPIPTWLLKMCINELLPLITTLINKSLSNHLNTCIMSNKFLSSEF